MTEIYLLPTQKSMTMTADRDEWNTCGFLFLHKIKKETEKQTHTQTLIKGAW